jgi:hypothetical protein
VVQTGKNTQLGGVNEGLLSVAYQAGIEDIVYNDPIDPARSGRAIQRSRRSADLSVVLSITYQGKSSGSERMNVIIALAMFGIP